MNNVLDALLARLRQGGQLRSEDYDLRLPGPPADVPWEALSFNRRMQNALSKAGFAEKPEQLRQVTVGDLYVLQNFGVGSLKTYLELARDWPVENDCEDCLSPQVLNQETPSAGSESASTSWEVTEAENYQRALARLRSRLQSGLTPDRRDRSVFLPSPQAETPLDALGFDNRTRNALTKAGFGSRTEALGDLTVARALRIKGFAVHCLRVYLEAASTWNSAAWQVPNVQDKLDYHRLADRLEALLDRTTIGARDLRFGVVLRRLLCSTSEELLEQLRSLTPTGKRTLELVPKLVDDVEQARRLTVEQEAVAVRRPRVGSRDEALIRAYFGFGRGAPATLTQVAQPLGISRERVRQIHSKGITKRSIEATFLPALRRTKAVLESGAVARPIAVEQDLRSQGLLEAHTTVAALLRYADISHVPIAAGEVMFGGTRVIVPREVVGETLAARAAAHRLIARHGATTATRVQLHLQRHGTISLGSPQIREILRLDGILRYLNIDGDDWFFTARPWAKPFTRCVRRILAVAKQLTVEELCQALRRRRGTESLTPPVEAVRGALSSIPGVVVEDDRVRRIERRPLEAFGGPDECAIVRLLQRHGGVCELQRLQRQAQAQGISEHMLWQCLSFSTLISRVGDELYGVVGARLPSGMGAQLQPIRRRALGLDLGRNRKGELWIAYRISEASVKRGIVALPGALRHQLKGDYRLSLARHGSFGTVRCRRYARGLKRALEEAGAKAGDCLVLRFDLTKQRAVVAIGDDSLIDECYADTR